MSAPDHETSGESVKHVIGSRHVGNDYKEIELLMFPIYGICM